MRKGNHDMYGERKRGTLAPRWMTRVGASLFAIAALSTATSYSSNHSGSEDSGQGKKVSLEFWG